MGKALLIKGADFENVAVAKIATHYNPVGVVDLNQYENLNTVINYPNGIAPYVVTTNATGADSYVVPVIVGETYKIKYCNGPGSFVVLGLDGMELEVESSVVQNHQADILYTGGTQGETYYDDDAEFVIPENVDSIFICGRNATNPGFMTGYELTLTRLS